ncbi:MAG: 3'-5' exonuclease, partial [Oscillospiraceae bacterium]
KEKLVSAGTFNTSEMIIDDVDVNFIKTVENVSKEEIEAYSIVEKIKGMVNSKVQVNDKGGLRNCKYSDFTILLRSIKSNLPIYKKVLEKENISVISENSKNILENKDIITFISLLNVINNPTNDIDMSSLMLSFIYRFTPDELAKIKLENKEISIYSNIINSKYKKATNFIKEINEFRQISLIYSLSDLFFYILDKTKFDNFIKVMKDGEQRLDDFRLFHEIVINFEKMGDSTLSGFLNYLDSMYKNNYDIKQAFNNRDNLDSVKIMSIHKSKGLEFNFVILAAMHKEFNKVYNKTNILISKNFGVNFIANKEGYQKEKTLPYIVSLIEQENLFLSEEMRILYVALTRAKEKLILFLFSFDENDVKNAFKDILCLDNNIGINKTLVSSKNSYSKWVVLCLLRNSTFTASLQIENLKENYLKPTFSLNINKVDEINAEKIDDTEKIGDIEKDVDFNLDIDDEIINLLKERQKFDYRYRDSITLPTKLSVSDVSKKTDNIYLKRPNFKKEKLTSTEKGNAMHKFMQFCNYENASLEPKEEIKRLSDDYFISNEEALCIDESKIKAFFKSEIGQCVLNSHKIYREYKFMTYLYPYEFSSEYKKDIKDKVLLQGIVDCMFEDNSGDIVLLDYKTDKTTEDNLKEIYSKQLYLYKLAIEQTLNKKVKDVFIYSFNLEKEIKLSF